MKLGPRKGDGAEVVIIELVTEPVAPKATAKVTKVVEPAPAKEEAPETEETAEAAE